MFFKSIVDKVYVRGVIFFSAGAENTVHINHPGFFLSRLNKPDVSDVSLLKHQEDSSQEKKAQYISMHFVRSAHSLHSIPSL